MKTIVIYLSEDKELRRVIKPSESCDLRNKGQVEALVNALDHNNYGYLVIE